MPFCLIDTGKKACVLLVEDHPDTLAAYKRLLEGAGYNVFVASGFKEALTVAASVDFDVLVADLKLSDGSGWELPFRIKQLKRRPIAAAALSAYAFGDEIEKSKRSGFLWHITKPASFDDLESVIHSLKIIDAALRKFLDEVMRDGGTISEIEDGDARKNLQRVEQLTE